METSATVFRYYVGLVNAWGAVATNQGVPLKVSNFDVEYFTLYTEQTCRDIQSKPAVLYAFPFLFCRVFRTKPNLRTDRQLDSANSVFFLTNGVCLRECVPNTVSISEVSIRNCKRRVPWLSVLRIFGWPCLHLYGFTHATYFAAWETCETAFILNGTKVFRARRCALNRGFRGSVLGRQQFDSNSSDLHTANFSLCCLTWLELGGESPRSPGFFIS